MGYPSRIVVCIHWAYICNLMLLRLVLFFSSYQKLKMMVIANDVVNTVVSVGYQNPNCKIGLVVGNAFNACYVVKWRKYKTDSNKDEPTDEVKRCSFWFLSLYFCLVLFVCFLLLLFVCFVTKVYFVLYQSVSKKIKDLPLCAEFKIE